MWRWVIVSDEELRRVIREVSDALANWECYLEGFPECEDEKQLLDSLADTLVEVLKRLRRWRQEGW